MAKRKWILVAGVSLVLAAVGLLAGCTPAAGTVQGALTGQQEGIWVTGEGKTSVAPDLVTLRLGVEAQEETVSQAQAGASDAMDRVMSALTGNDLDDEDIQTRYFSIRQVTRWDPDREEQVVTGYQVTNTVTAKVRDVEGVGAVIDDVVEAGGDFVRIEGMDFSVEDPSQYHRELRRDAMDDAQTKAEQLAAFAGVRLGKVTLISEGSVSVPRAATAVQMDEVFKVGGGATPISPGDIEISLTVQVAYAIR